MIQYSGRLLKSSVFHKRLWHSILRLMQIIQQLMNRIFQRANVMNLEISTSTVIHILKRFRKPVLNAFEASDATGLKVICNRYYNIVSWSRYKTIIKQWSWCIYKNKMRLYHLKPYIYNIQVLQKLLWPWAHLRCTDLKWKVHGSLTTPHVRSFLELMAIEPSGPKSKRTIQIILNAEFKSQHLWLYVGILVPIELLVAFTSEKAPLILVGT